MEWQVQLIKQVVAREYDNNYKLLRQLEKTLTGTSLYFNAWDK